MTAVPSVEGSDRDVYELCVFSCRQRRAATTHPVI